MAFAIKGQTKAAVAFKCNFGVYEPILFKLCMQVAYWPLLVICYMTFTIKGQTKAAATFKGNFGVYGPILFKVCMQVADWPSLMIVTWPLQSKAKQRPQQPLKLTLELMGQFCPKFACRYVPHRLFQNFFARLFLSAK